MSKKLWSGRFSKYTDPVVEQFTSSIQFDQTLIYEDLLGSLAHADMLTFCGVLNQEEGQLIKKGLMQIVQKVAANEIVFKIEDEDIHMNVERLLTEIIGPMAGKLHTARSRNDQVALDIHLYIRKQVLAIIELLLQLQITLLDLAQQHHEIILPGYTHLQRAQPIYLAQHWYAYVAMFQRDIERLQANWLRINLSPLGACALTGTTFPTDRNYVANKLGFDGIYLNSLDAVSDRDFVIEFLANSSLIMMHISRLSEELILWSSQEFNFISFDDAFSTGSSIMPQKKNPDVTELGRGKTGRVYGALFTLLTLLKGLPLAYNKDLQEDKEPLFDVVKTLRQTLTVYVPLLATLTVNSANMRQAAEVGFLNATVLAEYFVKNGMTFRVAHETVGKMVSFCLDKNCRLEDLSLSELQKFSPTITEEVYQILSVENAAAACNKGSDPKATLIEKETAGNTENISKNEQWISEKKERLTSVYANFGIPFQL